MRAGIFLPRQIPAPFALSTDNNIFAKFLSISCKNVEDVPLFSVHGVVSNAKDVPEVREAAGAYRIPESCWNSLLCFMEESDATAQGAARIHAQGCGVS
jgi:hypothetical protein